MIYLLHRYYPIEAYRDAGLEVLTHLLSFALEREREEKQWQEWLAFTPIAAISGGKVMSFRDYLTASKPKQKAPMSVIDNIRRKFNL